MQPRALNIDGPVLHNARAAIETARSRKMLGGIFVGFGSYDEILTGFAQILRYVREGMTPRRREIIDLLRAGGSQIEAAAALDISKQAVSMHTLAAGWETYRAAEQGWRVALGLATGAKK
jgi:DNA-binding NarL/FixJ family response regulator